MPTTLHDDPDPIDRARGIDLASAGLPGYCAAVAIGADGDEYLMLAAYGLGVADGRVFDWNHVAAHEIPGLPVYIKED